MTSARGSACPVDPSAGWPCTSAAVITSSCGMWGSAKERIERRSRPPTVAGPPQGWDGSSESTPSACSMITLRWVTPSNWKRPIWPRRV